jgi:hypothetical protein
LQLGSSQVSQMLLLLLLPLLLLLHLFLLQVHWTADC